MRIFRDFFAGLRAYSRGWRFMGQHKLRWFFIFPFVANLLIFLGGVLGVGFLSGEVSDLVKEGIQGWFETWTFPDWLAWIIDFIFILLFKLLWFLIFAMIIGTLILILLSPVFAVLSERTEALARGKAFPFKPLQLVKDVLRGAYIAIRNFFLQNLTWLILLIFTSWFPPLTAVLMAFVIAYFYGFSFLDYTNERWKFKTRKSVKVIRKYKGAAASLGMVFYLTLIIPQLIGLAASVFTGFLGTAVVQFLGSFVVGFFASSVAMVGVVGGTLFLLDQEEFTPEVEVIEAEQAD